MDYIEKLTPGEVSHGITWIDNVPMTNGAVYILAKKINEIVDVVNGMEAKADES